MVRKEVIPKSCPLTFTCDPWHADVHAYTQIINLLRSGYDFMCYGTLIWACSHYLLSFPVPHSLFSHRNIVSISTLVLFCHSFLYKACFPPFGRELQATALFLSVCLQSCFCCLMFLNTGTHFGDFPEFI